ncbi:hypothetical protein QQ008_07370 [Fulvivirgaceae bacterium BMA10]|uniref:Secreted protein n=1 Tax=Splendidivirga corallicola TaxID=3051826 RepID=A0ABT8KKE1_9BACT|nr:hypothetical protein [Fulvivirgaceae bacterium BMA10]
MKKLRIVLVSLFMISLFASSCEVQDGLEDLRIELPENESTEDDGSQGSGSPNDPPSEGD